MPSRTKEQNRQYQQAWRNRMTPEERKEYDKNRYKKYKAKYNRNSKKWVKNNPHKAHASTHQTLIKNKYPEVFSTTDIITKDLAEWLNENRGKPCPYCGTEAFHIDHINPLSQDGTHTWDNIEIICETCNLAKRDKNKEEFQEWIKNLIHFTELK